MAIAAFFIGVCLCIVVHVSAMAAMSFLLKRQMREVCYGFGPRMIRRRSRGMRWTVRWIPLGGYVKHWDWDRLPFWKEICLQLIGPIALYLIALSILGPKKSSGMFLSGFGQIILGALHPWAIGKELVLEMAQYTSANSFISLFGAMSAKLCASQLLPLPTLNGGAILMRAAKLILRFSKHVEEQFALMSLSMVFALFVGWAMAAYYAWRT